MEEWSIGVMDEWSIGLMKNPALHLSIFFYNFFHTQRGKKVMEIWNNGILIVTFL